MSKLSEWLGFNDKSPQQRDLKDQALARWMESNERMTLARQATINQMRLTYLQDQSQQQLERAAQQSQDFRSTRISDYTGLETANNPYSTGVQRTGAKDIPSFSAQLGFTQANFAEFNKPERQNYATEEEFQNAMTVWRTMYGKQ